uniref:GAE domain-containing protein n=1 Tax=Rhabditophanes sp. KR3021 TaxID=114890 RepID=A0AC35UDZ4_9BILA
LKDTVDEEPDFNKPPTEHTPVAVKSSVKFSLTNLKLSEDDVTDVMKIQLAAPGVSRTFPIGQLQL